jgi:hypothetical protein
LLHGSGLAKEIAAGVGRLIMTEVLVDFEELNVVFGFAKCDFKLIEGERLDEVIKCSGTNAFDGGIDGSESADDDDEWFLGTILEVTEEVRAFAVGQADVDDGEVEGVASQGVLGCGKGIDGEDLVTTLAEVLFDSFADNQVIFEDENSFKRHDRMEDGTDGHSDAPRSEEVGIGADASHEPGRARGAGGIVRFLDPTESPS